MSSSYRSPIAAQPDGRPSRRHGRWLTGEGQVHASHDGQSLARPAISAALIIAGFLVIRLCLMLAIGFGNDEAYTLAGARSVQLSYFDHPPLHVWLTHFTALLVGETLWVRLPFVLLFTGTSWLLFLVTRHLYGPKAAVW